MTQQQDNAMDMLFASSSDEENTPSDTSVAPATTPSTADAPVNLVTPEVNPATAGAPAKPDDESPSGLTTESDVSPANPPSTPTTGPAPDDANPTIAPTPGSTTEEDPTLATNPQASPTESEASPTRPEESSTAPEASPTAPEASPKEPEASPTESEANLVMEYSKWSLNRIKAAEVHFAIRRTQPTLYRSIPP